MRLALLLIPVLVLTSGCVSYVGDVADYFMPYFTSGDRFAPGGPCDFDGDCNAWEYCDNHLCAAKPGFCVSVDECDEWETCSTEHRCRLKPSRCNTDMDCPLARPECGADHYCNR